MLKGYFDTIPRELEESALMDGASPATIFFRIVLPLAKPAVAVTALFSFMTGWNEFIQAATFMDKETMYTAPVGLRFFVGGFSQQWGYFAAGVDHRLDPGRRAVPVPAEVPGLRPDGRSRQGLKPRTRKGGMKCRRIWIALRRAAASRSPSSPAPRSAQEVVLQGPDRATTTGPGDYVYPTDEVYKPGSFDLTEFKMKVTGDKADFAVAVNSKLEDPWGMGAGFAVQMVFIFIDTDNKAGQRLHRRASRA